MVNALSLQHLSVKTLLLLFKRKRGYMLVVVKVINQVGRQKQGVKAVQLVCFATMRIRNGVPAHLQLREVTCLAAFFSNNQFCV